MARKATDLLDVFRFSSEGGGDDSGSAPKKRRPSRKQAAKKKGGGGRRKARFEGIALNRRQVVLASSAIGLLLILSFFLGLAAGGSGGDDTDAALERRAARRYVIRAFVPLVDPAARKPADPVRLARNIARDYGIDPRNLRARRRGADIAIDIGPFPSRDEARRWLERSGLELCRIHMQDPFRFPEYIPLAD
jgi:hypothetical protein